MRVAQRAQAPRDRLDPADRKLADGVLAREDRPRPIRKVGPRLQEPAEALGLDEEVDVRRRLRFPVGRDQTVEVLADGLARLGEVEGHRCEAVGAVEHAVGFHAPARDDPGQPAPLLVRQLVADAQGLGLAADAAAEGGRGRQVGERPLELDEH